MGFAVNVNGPGVVPEDGVTESQFPPETGVMLAVNGAGVPLVVKVIIEGAGVGLAELTMNCVLPLTLARVGCGLALSVTVNEVVFEPSAARSGGRFSVSVTVPV